MTVVIALLRGINVGGHHKIKMEALRTLFQSLGLRDIQTHLQSGNVVFRTSGRDLVRLRQRIEEAVEREFGFHCDVVLRTTADLRVAVAKNPFATRPDLDASRLAVHFLSTEPDHEARARVLAIKAEPEELHLEALELYIYFTNGMARLSLSMAVVERSLKTSGTSRNWNTVRKVLEMAEKLES
jgi:uncharacterized protein (DUF1697 family)